MRDRLAELRREAPPVPETAIEVEQEENFMAAFFSKVKLIKDNIGKIETDIKTISDKHNDLLGEVQHDQQKVVDDEIHRLMDNVSRLARGVRAALKSMEEENKKIEKESQGLDGLSTEVRIRQSQHTTLMRTFTQVMTKYNDIQAKNKKKYRDMIVRQCKIVEINDEKEIENVVETGGAGLFTGRRMEDAEQALQIIEDRHQDILALEKSLVELHDMFMDMAMLVEKQGEMIDRIDYSVDQSANYTRQAAEQTGKALAYQTAARHKKICLAICCLILIVLIVAIIASVVGK